MDTDHRPWVLVAGAFLKTGGQDRANYALASYLARQGTAVHVVSHSIGDSLGAGTNISTHIARRPLRSDILGEPFLRRLGYSTAAAASQPHVLVNGGNCDWPDVNWVHYVHAAYDRPADGHLLRRARLRLSHHHWLQAERTALLRARVVLANSRRTMRDLVDRVGVPADRIRVVYYGIDAAQFRPAEQAERITARAALGWPADRPVALFIGALGDRRKGFDTLFRTWQELARRRVSAPLLVAIGSGSLLPEWQRRVQTSGLSDSIRFLGFRNDVPHLVRAADMLVAPTRYEAYGLGVHEALCSGLPAIVSADAGVAERYPAELNQLLLPDPDDHVDLARRVARVAFEREAFRGPLDAFASRLRARSWDDMSRDIVAAVCAG